MGFDITSDAASDRLNGAPRILREVLRRYNLAAAYIGIIILSSRHRVECSAM